jgi:hypothetical protein
MGDWRADWEARFSTLLADGLPARLHLELLPGWTAGDPGLWVLRLEPLAPPDAWAPRTFDWDYHISIAEADVPSAEELHQLHVFDGLETVVRFGERHGAYLTVVGALGEYDALIAAHARGRYANRPLHVSM